MAPKPVRATPRTYAPLSADTRPLSPMIRAKATKGRRMPAQFKPGQRNPTGPKFNPSRYSPKIPVSAPSLQPKTRNRFIANINRTRMKSARMCAGLSDRRWSADVRRPDVDHRIIGSRKSTPQCRARPLGATLFALPAAVGSRAKTAAAPPGAGLIVECPGEAVCCAAGPLQGRYMAASSRPRR
jgi:hypothetical protein